MTTRQMMDEWGADRLKLAAAEARVRELEAALKAVTPSHRRTGECWCGHGAIEHTPACRQAQKALKGGAK